MEPQVIKKAVPQMKTCSCCCMQRLGNDFIVTKSWFYTDGLVSICNYCIKDRLVNVDFHWVEIDKICQMINIPFIPMEWDRIKEINGDDAFPIYARIFQDTEYEELGWDDYFEKFKELRDLEMLDRELPELHEKRLVDLRSEWGGNYDEEELTYLEGLFNGMMSTQSINGALQMDQAHKLCKISLEIDKRIRSGADFDKLMGSYDKMVKTAEFTPKNLKSDNDFDSFGEVFAWLEKRGWLNEYYDGAKRDVVDEVIQNLQAFNQRLYVNESGIGEEITARAEALKMAQELEKRENMKPEDTFGLDVDHDLDAYSNDGYNALEEFSLEEDEGGAYV